MNPSLKQMCIPALVFLFLGASPFQASGQVPTGLQPPEAPPPIPSWAKAFEVFQDSPRPIAYLVSQRAFQTGTFLIQGVRSKDDRPTAGLPIYGAIGPGDWMLEDISGAIRISGIPAPEPGRRVILAAQFTAGDPQPSLKVLHMVASGLGDGTDVIRVGEHLHLPMPSSKSTSLYPEFSGDTAAIEALFLHESVILRGIRPGIVSVKVFEQWWNRAAPELHGEFKLTVKDREASRK